MCGIAGAYGGQIVQRDILEKQLELLAHRGPDSFGVFEGERGVIGQTRLSIIDLITGDPPIANEDGRVGVAFNGEIYNYLELRDELAERGHSFSTNGDTEVIAHLAEDLEPVDVARALDGMFAFAVLDRRSGRLILGRDRLGKKPLYYWSASGQFVFASELKALLAHPAVPRALNKDALEAYLTFGYVPTPLTFFDGIKSVPPGHVLTIDSGGDPVLTPYWSLLLPGASQVDRYGGSFEDAARDCRSIFERAVKRRLISDVPLGAFLSGGIDSSAVVGTMAGCYDQPVKTFTIGFEDTQGFDERSYARTVADRFQTEHTEFVVEPNAIELIEELVWHHDQPFGDSSALPTYLLSKLTRQHVTVALSGDGGDELFAGYERFAAALAASRYSRAPAAVQRLAEGTSRLVPARALGGRAGSLQRFLARAGTGLPDALRAWVSYVHDERRRELLPASTGWADRDYRRVWDESAGADTLDRLLLLNLHTYLVDDLLVKADRMSMAHGLEVRSPFLDRELVEFAFTLPPSFKARGFALKRVLKKAFEEVIPKEILNRRKRGFGVPLDRWFREDLKSFVQDSLGPNSRVRTYVDGAALDRLVGEHDRRIGNHGHAMWALMTLELFLRREGW